MFCYNCGNEAVENAPCPFCNKFLPALNPAKVRHSMDVLDRQENAEEPIDDTRDGYDDFLSGEVEFESIAKYSGNVLRAYEHYKIASDKGIGEASNMMGVISELYWDTLYGHWEVHDCAKFYEKGAHQGCKEAMANLARVHISILQSSDGNFQAHKQQAYYWFGKSAEKGFLEAVLALAVLYSYDNRDGKYTEQIYKLICAVAQTGDSRGEILKQTVESGKVTSLDLNWGVLKVKYFAYGTFLPFRAKSTCYTPSPTLYFHENHTMNAGHIVASYYDESIID